MNHVMEICFEIEYELLVYKGLRYYILKNHYRSLTNLSKSANSQGVSCIHVASSCICHSTPKYRPTGTTHACAYLNQCLPLSVQERYQPGRKNIQVRLQVHHKEMLLVSSIPIDPQIAAKLPLSRIKLMFQHWSARPFLYQRQIHRRAL